MSSPLFEPVALSPSLRKRFYEPIVLLYCLTAAYIERGMIEPSDSEPTTPRSREKSFRVFVCKLAQICDSKRGGDTVTAFAVLQPNTVQYRFASNKRYAGELKKVKAYIGDILNQLGSASDEDIKHAVSTQGPIFSDILQKIVKFNRRRLNVYIKGLANNLSNCIRAAVDEAAAEGPAGTSSEASKVVRVLKDWLPLAVSASGKPGEDGKRVKLTDEEFAEKTQTLMQAIHGGYKGLVEDFVAEHCVPDHNEDRTHWDEIYHALGRLLSYFSSVTVLIRARRFWPVLFRDFEILAVPSSRPNRDPPAIRKSAEKIVGTLTSRNAGIVEDYKRNAEDLQRWGLDKSIQEHTHHDCFKPIVHAEVLVDDSIRRDRRETLGEPLNFFMEDDFGKYIGASKPTCRLCSLYFNSQPDGVAVRASHNNLYHKWRGPDVLATDPESVRKERDVILEAMIPKLRDAVCNAIRQRSAPWRRFDSNNTATSPAFPTATDITTQMGSMRISSGRGDTETVRGSSPDTVDEYDDSEVEGSEDDEDEE